MIRVFPIHSGVKSLFTLFLLLFFAAATGAQAPVADSLTLKAKRPPVHFIKVGSPLVNLKSWAAGYELRLSARNSLTFNAQYISHNNPASLGLFNGDINVHFVKEEYTITRGYYPYELLNKEVVYSGTQPLPPITEFTPVRSLTFDAGWRFTHRGRKGLFWLFEPGFTLTYHQYIQTRQFLQEIYKNVNSGTAGEYPYSVTQTTTISKSIQTQRMRYHDRWLPCASYQLGVGYHLTRRLVAEFRGGGIFVPDVPYESPQPAPVKPIQFRFAVMVGYGF